MKKTIINTGLVVITAFILLFVFNKITSKADMSVLFAEVRGGDFEISLTATGELMAENSVDIKGPDFSQRRDIRATNIKIQDLIPEGTFVNKGDFIATLDRTELNNSLKDERERLASLQANLDMKMLDTAVNLNELRDGIRNQRYIVEEAAVTLKNSKYEPPTRIRQAEIELDKSQRVLEQRQRNYTRILAQYRTDIYNQKYYLSRITRRVKDLEEILEGFTITSPASGMVVYMREWRGGKRKAGSTINPFDRVVATLPDLSTLISKTFVNEIDISKIKSGQTVKITIDAFPEKRFTGVVTDIANIGEKLPNTEDKVFEVHIKIDGSDPLLRPSMTTGNKIIIKTIQDAIFVPTECLQADVDSIPFVYTKNGTRQIVLLGESNEKNTIVEKGLEPGTMLYLSNPDKKERFKLSGDDLIPIFKEREKLKKADFGIYRREAEVVF